AAPAYARNFVPALLSTPTDRRPSVTLIFTSIQPDPVSFAATACSRGTDAAYADGSTDVVIAGIAPAATSAFGSAATAFDKTNAPGISSAGGGRMAAFIAFAVAMASAVFMRSIVQ